VGKGAVWAATEPGNITGDRLRVKTSINPAKVVSKCENLERAITILERLLKFSYTSEHENDRRLVRAKTGKLFICLADRNNKFLPINLSQPDLFVYQGLV
jgi:hypothetical protein